MDSKYTEIDTPWWDPEWVSTHPQFLQLTADAQTGEQEC